MAVLIILNLSFRDLLIEAFYELFNLSNDISERHNVAQDHGDVARRLALALKLHRHELERNARPCGTVDTSQS